MGQADCIFVAVSGLWVRGNKKNINFTDHVIAIDRWGFQNQVSALGGGFVGPCWDKSGSIVVRCQRIAILWMGFGPYKKKNNELNGAWIQKLQAKEVWGFASNVDLTTNPNSVVSQKCVVTKQRQKVSNPTAYLRTYHPMCGINAKKTVYTSQT